MAVVNPRPGAAAPAQAKIHFVSEEFATIQELEREHLGIPAQEKDLFGLALSGGGIRSASFALGVLQALHGFNVFDRFHYLSTVSGGGYIGSSLTYFRNVFSGFGQTWFPFGYLTRGSDVRAIGARTPKPTDPGKRRAFEIVSFLRQHASFLTPSRKLDRPALSAGVLRGLVSSILPYMCILVGILGVSLALGAFDNRLGTDGAFEADALTAISDGRHPGFYLAYFPALLAIVAILVVLGNSLLQVIGSSLASKGREIEAVVLKRYSNSLNWLYALGMVLLACGGLTLVALLPWLHDYLGSLLNSTGELPTTFAALFAAIGGAAAQIAKLRSIIGGDVKKPSALKSLLMVLAGVIFVFSVILLGYIAAFHVVLAGANCLAPLLADWGLPWPGTLARLLPALAVGGGGLILAIIINVNHANQHRLYRDRLMEVFCAEQSALEKGQWCPANKAQTGEGWLWRMNKVRRPLHLIGTTLITTDSEDRKFRGRGGDNFLLSPLFCGSDATGWVKTETGMSALSIATAASISGAALNAHAGPHGSGGLRNKAYAALLSFLGLNLGYWARNPLKFKDRDPDNLPKFFIPNLIKPGLKNISGRSLDEKGDYVLLSDGGHFENLAIYELIRRKVRFLWVSDAGQDTKFSFEDLSSAIERVRVDFGVNIRFYDEDYDLTHLLPGSAETETTASKNFADEYHLAKRGYAIGVIEYADGSKGTIVYVKSTLTRNLPGDIYGYKARNDDYPHQTTLDQFFDEEQFEAYRELGYRLAATLFRDIETAARPGQKPLAKPLADVKALLGL